MEEPASKKVKLNAEGADAAPAAATAAPLAKAADEALLATHRRAVFGTLRPPSYHDDDDDDDDDDNDNDDNETASEPVLLAVDEIPFEQHRHLLQLKAQGKRHTAMLWLHQARRTLVHSAPTASYAKIPHEHRSVNHWGQRKLMLSEVEFLTRFYRPGRLVVYAGAAPGTHTPYLASLFPGLDFFLVDPAPFQCDFSGALEVTRSRIELRNEFFDAKTVAELLARRREILFISDIRTADPKVMQREEVEQCVARDMEWQMDWACGVQAVASMHKFRLPWGDGQSRYLGGDIYLPVWGPQTTTETRLVVTDHSPANRERVYDNRLYEQQMFYFNTVTRVQFYQHDFLGIQGICACYDCAAELLLLIQYIQTVGADQGYGAAGCRPLLATGADARSGGADPELVRRVAAMSAILSERCSTSGSRHLDDVVDAERRSRWFDARVYNVDEQRIEVTERREPTEHDNDLGTDLKPRALGSY